MATRKLGGNGYNNIFVILIVVMVSHVCVYIYMSNIKLCTLYTHRQFIAC